MVAFDKTLVVIPAAGVSKDAYGNQTSYPACLKMIDGKPLIFWIVQDLQTKGFVHFSVGVRNRYKRLVQNSLLSFHNLNITVHDIHETKSELDTIQQMLLGAEFFESLLINSGDTFCSYALSDLTNREVAAVYGLREESLRWASIEISPDSTINKIFMDTKSQEKKTAAVLTGVFWWRDIKSFIQVADPLSTQVVRILMNFERVYVTQSESWVDGDHADIFELDKQAGIQSRHFNNIEIDSLNGVITKRSSNVEKLVAEIRYYESLPAELKILFPRMISYEVGEKSAKQVLEYYPMRTLSEIFTQEDVPLFLWDSIFQRLSDITHNRFTLIQSNVRISVADFFLNKIYDRTKLLRDFPSFDPRLIESDTVVVNNGVLNGLSWVLEKSRQYLDGLESQESIVHGDFCFSNILCDVNTGVFKLIDPRGGFASESIFGPKVYDVAKLAHSVFGRYDFIIAGQFGLREESRRYEFEIAAPENYDLIINSFIAEYLDGNWDERTIRLLSALILLSIPLLHLDYPPRAMALFLNGLIEANLALEGF